MASSVALLATVIFPENSAMYFPQWQGRTVSGLRSGDNDRILGHHRAS
jgi:hypothetical protein